MGLRELLGSALGSGFKLPLPWMPSQSLPSRLPPVQLPRDERPHDRSIEWWHFMGSFGLLRAGDDVPDPPAAPHENNTSDGRREPGLSPKAHAETAGDPPGGAKSEPLVMTFVLSILKARVQGVTQYASFVILVDHERRTHSISTKLGAPGAVYFEPTDGSALRFHFGPAGVARPGPPEAWSVAGGMGVYQLNIDTSRQIAMDLRQLDSPAVLVGSRPELDEDDGDEDEAPREKNAKDLPPEPERLGGDKRNDGVMQYLNDDQMGYYAFPAMSLDGVLGTGADERAITGCAWMEHQWGDFPVGDYRWKYIAINLRWKEGDVSKKAQLLVFHFRLCATGSGRSRKYGVFVNESGTYQILDGIGVNTPEGSRSFGNYPVRTHVSWSKNPPQGKTPDLELDIEPLFDDQECRTNLPVTIFPVFWEGACKVSGKVAGLDISKDESWAITELAGYE